MPLTVVTSERFQDHVTPPGHPERVDRAVAMRRAVARWAERGGAVVAPRAATDEDLLRVHTPAHLDAIRATRGRAAMLDADTFTSPDSDDVGRLAAGAVMTGVDLALDGGAGARALAVVRPPGHHAEADKAMGFCLYNSVAVGAAYARHRGVSRVAVMDYDVHHGNGTQWIFYEDPSVLFVSTHQYPFYPGTGAAEETGRGAGDGYTVNVPLEAGATDADYDLVFRDAVLPALAWYRPELLLVSAGFDAHERDPLAYMRMSTEGFARLTARLLVLADQVAGGRTVFVTEGGYDLHALETSLEAVIGLLAGERTTDLAAPPAGDTARGAAALGLVRTAHGGRWTGGAAGV
ncbi:MAG: histone deacetylase [Vicinamibacterales bacterium]